MNAADNTLTELLRGRSKQYLLLRVGSSTSCSEHVLPGDLDYVCILPDESGLNHERELSAMVGSFANVGGAIGFVPKWPKDHREIPKSMQESLSSFHIDFHFGPVASEGLAAVKQSIHFAGPITLGDYEFFRKAFPVLAYIFETYQKCLLGDASVICSQTKRPGIEQFIKLTLLNCGRFQRSPNAHVSSMAVKKILLLRSIWRKLDDPYRESRLEWKKMIGRESELVDYSVVNTEQLLESSEQIEYLLAGAY